MSEPLEVGAVTKIVEVAGLAPTLKTIMDLAQQFLGNNGNGSFTLTPGNGSTKVVVPIGNGASVQLPTSIAISYQKVGNLLKVHLDKPVTAIWKMISVEVAGITLDTTQANITFNGLAGMLASITLKASP